MEIGDVVSIDSRTDLCCLKRSFCDDIEVSCKESIERRPAYYECCLQTILPWPLI